MDVTRSITVLEVSAPGSVDGPAAVVFVVEVLSTVELVVGSVAGSDSGPGQLAVEVDSGGGQRGRSSSASQSPPAPSVTAANATASIPGVTRRVDTTFTLDPGLGKGREPMKRMLARALVAVVAAMSVCLPVSPALADHYGGGDDYRYREGDCENGGCGQRDEEYGDNSCKYVCPDFKDSPVHDAFNFAPVICLPGSTCHVDGDRGENRGGQDGGGSQP